MTASSITAVLQIFLFVTNVACLIWFNRLRRRLFVAYGDDFKGRGRPGIVGPPVQQGQLRPLTTAALAAARDAPGNPRAVSMITFSNDDGLSAGSRSDNGIRVTTTEEEYANQQETKMQHTRGEAPSFARNGDIVLGVDDVAASSDVVEPDAVLDFSVDYGSDGLDDVGNKEILMEDGFDIASPLSASMSACVVAGVVRRRVCDDLSNHAAYRHRYQHREWI